MPMKVSASAQQKAMEAAKSKTEAARNQKQEKDANEASRSAKKNASPVKKGKRDGEVQLEAGVQLFEAARLTARRLCRLQGEADLRQ